MAEHNKIEDILNSFDGMRRAEPRPFLYTRVMAKMQGMENSRWSRIGSYLARPIIAVCCLTGVIAANIYFVVSQSNKEQETESTATLANSASDLLLQNENYVLAVNN